MREVLARSDHDFRVYDSPSPKQASSKQRAQGRNARGRAAKAQPPKSALATFARVIRPFGVLKLVVVPLVRRPATALTALLMTSCALFIVVNALALQPRQHPAPLFGSDRGRSPQEPAQRPTEVAARPTPPATVQQPATPQQTGAVLPPSRPAVTRDTTGAKDITSALPPARPDLIGDLIKGGAPPSSASAGASSSASPQASLVLLNAQKALSKLGYAVKPDGLMGPATQRAIETFERDHGLAVTGEPNPRMLKSLAAASGMPVE